MFGVMVPVWDVEFRMKALNPNLGNALVIITVLAALKLR
jgi:hypothetical protein